MRTAWIWIALAGAALATARAAEADTSTVDIWESVRAGNVEAIRQLAAAGADLNRVNPNGGSTPLIAAAALGRTRSAEALIDLGAGLNRQNTDGSTALHTAAFFCRNEIVEKLLDHGADPNLRNRRGETPLDVVSGDWDPGLEGLYRYLAGLLEVDLDLGRIRADRPRVATRLREAGGVRGHKLKPAKAATGYRGAYFVDGEIHVNTFGMPDGEPLTSGHQDFKPSWSKTGDMLVFFRRLRDDPVVTNWKTAIHVIHVDGSGLHPLSDGTHTDFNPTWTRDGTNTPVWNRKHPDFVRFQVVASEVENRPGQEIALTDPDYHTWAYSCLMDGRILVQCDHPTLGWGYYLMTPEVGGDPTFERIACPMATNGILDRISISPSETRVCFEYQTGFEYRDTGRTLFIADFDAAKPAITAPRAFANVEGAERWFAYPRWTRDEKAIVYHASPSLYLYTPADGHTVQVSTRDGADYRYPHGEATPK